MASEPSQTELDKMTDQERALHVGRTTAEENVKAEQKRSTTAAGYDREDVIKDAQETAELNHKADLENNKDLDSTSQIPKNNTSLSAKEQTAKSQLDPTGDDPISSAEVKRSAHDASMDTGNKTAVSNEEQAARATQPGEAEEENSFSTADGGVTEDLQSSEVQKTGEKSTSNTNPDKGSKS